LLTRENNLYVYVPHLNKRRKITTDGKKCRHGITDWVYEEEFAFVKLLIGVQTVKVSLHTF
jgi:dipeptidyl-peptidase-4